MSLLGGIGNFFKKAAKGVAKIIDNPVTRAIGQVNPGVGLVTGIAQGIAGNVPTALQGGVYQTGQVGMSSGWLPTTTGFLEDPRFGGSGATGYWDMAPVGGGLPSGTGVSCAPKVLRSGKVRYPRRRADGSCYFPRRMNPLNPRAARRAIRRIKAVRRITRDIERSLPKARARARS